VGHRKKRKMQRLSTIVATFTLLFALGGTAAAASHHHYVITSTGQIGPKVLKQLRGKVAGSQVSRAYPESPE
jgi:hypothetical protein